ncbi:uncharacterized protein LOC130622324 isoform X2 [Hydractinia symbiolongicarpus]|uniref:uncharacterized protein LOC130622324 isoform X2 n=1 Tax=Hydractinia symbiolongicarpus TaxID=13093 RepID=UPI002549D919|nr:uncharacterized protein LOC130622324 isoform X2 [Hydractinia symbiolongicarpus]
MIYFILFLTFFINKSSSNIKVQRNKGPDTFTGLECNQSRYSIEDKHNGGCKCFDTQQIFSSYGKHETGCYKGDSIRKNPDIEHEFITVNNVTTQIKTTLCELNKIEKLFIWDVIYNLGTWNEYKVLEDVVNTNAIYITISERKNWDGLLIHFLYSCKTDNKMRSCVVKFTGDIVYPFERNFPLQKLETTKPTEAVSTTTTKKKTTESATTKSVTTVKTTSKIITKKATSQGATTVVKDKRNEDDKQNIGIIVGIIVVVILILVALVFCFIWRKKRSRNNGKKQDVKEPLYAEYTPNKTSEQKVSLKSPSKDEESHYDTTYTQAYESHNPEAHWNTYDYAATEDLKENNEQKYIPDDPYYYSTAAAVLTEPTVEYAQVDKTKTNQKHTNEYQENNLNNKKEKNEEPHYYSTTKPAEEASKDSVSRNQQDDPYYYSTAASAEPVVTDEYAQVQKNNN